MSLYDSCLSPKKARLLPENSRERSIASHSLRQAWHYLFDYCPKLLAMYPPSGKEFLDPFLEKIDNEETSLGWKIFFVVMDHHRENKTLTKELCSELMVAAAIRWTISDFSKNQSIFIVEKTFGISVFGLKSQDIDQDKVFRTLDHDNLDDSSDVFYSTSPSRELEGHDNWELINHD